MRLYATIAANPLALILACIAPPISLTTLPFPAALYCASNFIDHPAVPVPLRYVLWPAYWFCQGVVCTGIWVVAHECGHGAFSSYTWLNDAVGLVFHSCLLVPYYSW